MRRSRRHILLACWLVVQLLFGQQLALAHMVGHVGDALTHAVAGADAGASDEDSEQGEYANEFRQAALLFVLTVEPVSYTHLTLPTSDLV